MIYYGSTIYSSRNIKKVCEIRLSYKHPQLTLGRSVCRTILVDVCCETNLMFASNNRGATLPIEALACQDLVF